MNSRASRSVLVVVIDCLIPARFISLATWWNFSSICTCSCLLELFAEASRVKLLLQHI